MILRSQDKSDEAGAKRSFDELYRSHGERIYRFCHRLCANQADAEDLAQEVFVAAFRGLPRFAGRASIGTWLYRIVLNRWRSMKARSRQLLEPLDRAGNEPISADSSHMSLERIAMDQAMARLPDIQREALLLVKGEGLTCREAAKALGIPEGTLKFRVYQAIQKLHVSLSEDEQALSAAAEVCNERA